MFYALIYIVLFVYALEIEAACLSVVVQHINHETESLSGQKIRPDFRYLQVSGSLVTSVGCYQSL